MSECVHRKWRNIDGGPSTSQRNRKQHRHRRRPVPSRVRLLGGCAAAATMGLKSIFLPLEDVLLHSIPNTSKNPLIPSFSREANSQILPELNSPAVCRLTSQLSPTCRSPSEENALCCCAPVSFFCVSQRLADHQPCVSIAPDDVMVDRELVEKMEESPSVRPSVRSFFQTSERTNDQSNRVTRTCALRRRRPVRPSV